MATNLTIQDVARREFLKLAGVGFVSAVTGRAAQVMAGTFAPGDIKDGHLVPPDKKLDKAWVQSLLDRGTKEVYRGKALDNK